MPEISKIEKTKPLPPEKEKKIEEINKRIEEITKEQNKIAKRVRKTIIEKPVEQGEKALEEVKRHLIELKKEKEKLIREKARLEKIVSWEKIEDLEEIFSKRFKDEICNPSFSPSGKKGTVPYLKTRINKGPNFNI